jgi:hypothetical protein
MLGSSVDLWVVFQVLGLWREGVLACQALVMQPQVLHFNQLVESMGKNRPTGTTYAEPTKMM